MRFFYSGAFGPTQPATTATLRNVTAVATNGNSVGIEMHTEDVGVITLNATNVIAMAAGRPPTSRPPTTAPASRSTSTTPTTTPRTSPAQAPRSPTRAGREPACAAAVLRPVQRRVPRGGRLTDDRRRRGRSTARPARHRRRGPKQGPAPNIGADEFTVAASTPAPRPATPSRPTRDHKGPKKKTFKRHFKFEFGGSEPRHYVRVPARQGWMGAVHVADEVKGLKRGKHIFAVRAIDQAGNPDPTPADRHWKVTKRPKTSRPPGPAPGLSRREPRRRRRA